MLEDDAAHAAMVSQWLSDAAHDVHVFATARDLRRHASRESFDAFLIDWVLPDQSGHDVLLWLRRERGEKAPAIFVTARDSEEDIVSGLRAGADDYVIKPVRRFELIARLEAVWRRFRPADGRAEIIELPPYRIDLARRQIAMNGMTIEGLTDKEFALAAFLFQNPGRLLSRGHLLESVWGINAAVPTRTLDTHISRLRKKLELHPANGFRLAPAYNYGYRLDRVDPAA